MNNKLKYTPEEAKQFIEYIMPIIQKEAQKRGYKIISTVISQSILEGACNKSDLARLHHNHFGMKCSDSWVKAGKPAVNYKSGEEYHGQKTEGKFWFRSYADDTSGIEGYYDFISTPRYKNLKSAKNYQEYAQLIKQDGWATSSTYVKDLCNIVKKYNLMRFDDVAVEYFPIVTGYASIVEALELIGVDSSKAYRKKIWNANFTGTYLYTSTQNLQMLNRLAEGNLIKP